MKSPQNKISKDKHFQDLMLHRIHDILLVSSPYDAFILEEDGRLTEQILHEYLGMNLSYAPRVWQANTASYAMDLLSRRSVDLVIIMMRISDMDFITFGQQIKKMYSKKPIIFLAFDESEIKQLPEDYSKFMDNVFVWTGNSNVFPAIIKYIEDAKNIKRDTRKGDVRSIIYIEDSPRYYSSILPIIYKEMLFHSKNLIDKSLNNTQRLLHMRGRPKVLLAKNYEQAEKYIKNYKKNILGVISDIRFPKNNNLHHNAGIIFAKFVHSIEPSMPILLLSNEEESLKVARQINPNVLNKNSLTLFSDLRDFMINNFGFGNFKFKLPSGVGLGEVQNVSELVIFFQTIPEESLDYHASKNHFSNWFAARGEFDLATEFRKLNKKDFKNFNERIIHHVNLIKESQKSLNIGPVSEFKAVDNFPNINFLRIGTGSLGGKARGLAFANTYLRNTNLPEKYPNINFRVPKVVVVSTDEFDSYMEQNNLWEKALSIDNNKDLELFFLKGKLSKKLVKSLKEFILEVKYPLAVRSSSLLEDSQYQPLAGMYSTFMLPNCHIDDSERLNQLCEAIKRVYASTFFQEPKALMDNITHRLEEEKMAVIIMEMIGQTYNDYYYPTFSGVAQSYNYYPISHMKREEGIAFTALGLGRTVVEGGQALRFSPYHPNILPQFYSAKSTIVNSQSSFYALHLNRGLSSLESGESKNLVKLQLSESERHGVLKYVGSVVSNDDGIVRDSLNGEGKRVVTFSPIIKFERFPLSNLLIDLLKLGQGAMGCPVELEFAVNIFDNKDIKDEFCLLQIKPMVFGSINFSNIKFNQKNNELLCNSNIVLGDGFNDLIYDIIYVCPESFDRSFTRNIASEIEIFNRKLGKENPYLLIGPGRWGTADPWLGIPVNWKQISNARFIIELGTKNLNPEPSFGSHFFQNVTSLRIGYFTVQSNNKKAYIDLDWLNKQDIKQSTKYLRWIHLKDPLEIYIDGSNGKGKIIKPNRAKIELMDEDESTGI